MDNFATLCCIGALVGVFLLSMLPRMFMGGAPFMRSGRPMSRRGPLYPTADDPDIESRGAFGDSSRGFRPEVDDPDIESRGSFGRSSSPFGGFGLPRRRGGGSGSNFFGGGRGRSGGRTNSPNVRSRGSFGRRR